MTSTFSTSANEEQVLAGLATSHLEFPVVGIGGSAGGLQALIKFFENMPANPGMAFVVILHLSPDHQSHAAEILQRSSALPVRQVKSRVPIEPDHVYVIAPRADLMMNDGHLQMAPKEREVGPAVAIDVFFRTLARVHGNHAFAVLLSGTGSDGAVGLARVKAEGGVTLAQAPEEAEHGDMPRAAIATDMVDIVLPVADMGRRLIDLWTNARHIRLPPVTTAKEAAVAQAIQPRPAGSAGDSEPALQEIMALLRAHTQHDFRLYKRGTVLRRIERRLQVNGLTDLESYRDFLRGNPREAQPLLQDLLISVTNFFRDPEAFDALARDVMPGVLRGLAAGEQARVWAAGCATGEEAYSLVMLMREAAESLGRPCDLQVFATDIDDQALAQARRGVYPGGIAADVSPERLRQFFVDEHGHWRIQTALREQVLFASHNLLRDPPFLRQDLICCRNVLIYLDQTAQAGVLEMFHYALKPGGYLFLGGSESADAAATLFVPVDKKNRIYRAQAVAGTRTTMQAAATTLLPARVRGVPLPAPPQGAAEPARREPRQLQASAQLHLQALQSISPASVLINAEHEVLHLSPTAGRYLEHAGGVPSSNLLHNVEPQLRLELRTALLQAAQSGAKAQATLRRTRPDGGSGCLSIVVHPLAPRDDEPKRLLVVFEEIEDATEPAAGPAEEDVDARDAAHHLLLARADDEIRQLKTNLQDTLEQSALSTEELKAANEELQAINEELRSATEELETGKEELQSMNEELSTVNFELRMKIEERGRINDDLQNLIASSEIATVFVDSRLRVKRFTPHASKLFNLIAADAGRSLLDITNRLDYDALMADAQKVFKELRPIERRVTTLDGEHLLARILPYRTGDDKIEGAVLTFIDITALKLAEDKVRAGEEQLLIAAATNQDFAIITQDLEGCVTAWNTGAERIFGWSESEILGQPSARIFTPEDRADGAPEQELRTALESGRAEDERWHLRKDGSSFYCSGVLTLLRKDGAKPGLVKIARDLSGSKRRELARENLLLREQQENIGAKLASEMKDRFLAVMSHELKQPLNLIQVSAELLTRLPETKAVPSALRIGGTIQRAVASQLRIIDDLLDLSRVRTGKLRLHPEMVNLNDVVRSLAEAASADLERRRIRLDVDSGSTLNCRCDRIRVEQIIWNLLNNAVKFTPEGGHVGIGLDSTDGMARITVSDSGIGIAAEALPNLFELFTQVEPQTVPGNSGLGIGLSLVQELARAHGGRAEVASEGLGKGATFTVWLPLSANQPPSDGDAPAAGNGFQGLRILTVDDDADSLNSFATLLSLEGATVEAVESSVRALELVTANEYDLLISDLNMPDMDGCALIREVRRRLQGRKLLAVSMSGYGEWHLLKLFAAQRHA